MAKSYKTDYVFRAEVAREVGDEYTFLEEYRASSIPLKVIHNECGHEYKTTPNNFLSGRRCPSCARKRKYSTKEFTKMVKGIVGTEYTVLGNYRKNNSKIKMRHEVCGEIYYVIPTNFLYKKRRCPKCYGVNKVTTQDCRTELAQLCGEEYTLLSEYRKATDKVLIKHNSCGHRYGVLWYAFKRGNRCPKCSSSRGEKRVAEVLSALGVNFQTEKSIGGVLRADFYLTDLHSFIEYDGIQHYKPIEFWGGNKALEECQRRDRIKNHYFDFLGFPYLRIPYYEYDRIEEIVTEFIEDVKEKGDRQWQ